MGGAKWRQLKDFAGEKVHVNETHAVTTEIYSALQLLEGQLRKRLVNLHTQLVQVRFTELKKRNTSDLSLWKWQLSATAEAAAAAAAAA